LYLKIVDTLDSKFIDNFFNPGQPQLPPADSLDQQLDGILPTIRPWSEDLREEKFFLNKAWLEIRDDEGFHRSILHFFNEDGEYMKSVDGDIQEGSWRYMAAANKLLIAAGGGEGELYNLAFMDSMFFILSKHGNQQLLGRKKYLVLVYEPLGARLHWKDLMHRLGNQYRDNNNFYLILAVVIVLVVAIVVALSTF
jgi:hypothetical protein